MTAKLDIAMEMRELADDPSLTALQGRAALRKGASEIERLSSPAQRPVICPQVVQGEQWCVWPKCDCPCGEHVMNRDDLVRLIDKASGGYNPSRNAVADAVLAALTPAAAPTQGAAVADLRDAVDRIIVSAMAWQPSENGPSYDGKFNELMARFDAASRSPAGCGTPGCTDPNCNYANEPAPDWRQDQADTSVMPRGPLPAECSGQVSERELHDFIMDDARGPLARAILQKYRLEPK